MKIITNYFSRKAKRIIYHISAVFNDFVILLNILLLNWLNLILLRNPLSHSLITILVYSVRSLTQSSRVIDWHSFKTW